MRNYFRKLEKAVAVRNSLLEKFSGKFRRCWKIPHRFSGSTKCYPCQGLGTFRQGKRLLENWPRLRERCWIFSSETATAFLSSSDYCATIASLAATPFTPTPIPLLRAKVAAVLCQQQQQHRLGCFRARFHIERILSLASTPWQPKRLQSRSP